MHDYHSRAVAAGGLCKSIKTKGRQRAEARVAVRKLFILLGRLFRCSHTGITLKLGAPSKVSLPSPRRPTGRGRRNLPWQLLVACCLPGAGLPRAPAQLDIEPLGARSGTGGKLYFTSFGGVWEDGVGDSGSPAVIMSLGLLHVSRG